MQEQFDQQFLLCITALFFLGWVIHLKFQIAGLKKQNERLVRDIQHGLKNVVKDVELGA